MIRHAVLADSAAIARIHIDGWRAAYPGIVPQSCLDALDDAERLVRWERILTAPTGSVLVSCDPSDPPSIAGWVHCGPTRDDDLPDAAEVYALYVAPSHWRRGHGARLLRAVEQQLPAGTVITLWVLEANAPSRRFYEQLGYRFDGTRKEFELGGAELGEVRYRRDPSQG